MTANAFLKWVVSRSEYFNSIESKQIEFNVGRKSEILILFIYIKALHVVMVVLYVLFFFLLEVGDWLFN